MWFRCTDSDLSASEVSVDLSDDGKKKKKSKGFLGMFGSSSESVSSQTLLHSLQLDTLLLNLDLGTQPICYSFMPIDTTD